MNYQQAAQAAIDCQDACNLSGVAKSFAGPVLDAIWAEARITGKGTDWVNQHPIVVLFVDKLASLARTQFDGTNKFSQAYKAVTQIASGIAPAMGHRNLIVDGTSTVEFITDGEGFRVSMNSEADKDMGPPYFVFDMDAQDEIEGPFQTYAEAKSRIDELSH